MRLVAVAVALAAAASVPLINTVAGPGGSANRLAWSSPSTLAVASDGQFAFTASGSAVLRINDDGVSVMVVAGRADGTRGFAGDGGPAANALLNGAGGLVYLPDLSLLVCDFNNNRVRKITSGGFISTLLDGNVGAAAGSGGAAAAALCKEPQRIALDSSSQHAFITCLSSSSLLRINLQTLAVTTVAGNGTAGNSGDGGLASLALVAKPVSIAVDKDGSVFFGDDANCRIRRIDGATGVISNFFWLAEASRLQHTFAEPRRRSCK